MHGSGGIAAATICAKNYLAQARVLAQSFAEHHPDVPFFVLLSDEVDGYFDPGAEPFNLLRLEEIGLPELSALRGRYSVMELATSLKPRLLEHLLERGFRAAMFLDPDILVLDRFVEVFDALESASLLLTPHVLEPPREPDAIERELVLLLSGTFNLGFTAVSNGDEGRRFLAWWGARLEHHCRLEQGRGMFFDQRWLDLAPLYFPSARLLRHPGYNVAYWNLRERELAFRDKRVLVKGLACRFVHFSGYDPAQPALMSRHAPNTKLADFAVARRLFDRYAELLRDAGHESVRQWPYAYESVRRGTSLVEMIERTGRSARLRFQHGIRRRIEPHPPNGAPRAEPVRVDPVPRDRSGTAAAVVATKRTLPEARVLARSFRRFHPEIPFFTLLADEVDGYFRPEAEPCELLQLSEIGIADLPRLRFHYDELELTFAAAPHLLRYLLDRGFSSLLLCKRESLLTGDLAPVLDRLARHPIVIMPHLLDPPEGEGAAERELEILRLGVFDAGLVGISESSAARAFLDWWQLRCRTHCRRAVGRALHYEQRWLDLVPSYFEGAHVLRDAGIGLGYWNLRERRPELDGGGELQAGGTRCRLVRFSGFDPERPERFSRHSPLSTGELGPVAALCNEYADLLLEAGYAEARAWPHAYASFEDGRPVTSHARAAYLDLGEGAARFGDPLRGTGPESFLGWWLSRRRERGPIVDAVARFSHLARTEGTRSAVESALAKARRRLGSRAR